MKKRILFGMMFVPAMVLTIGSITGIDRVIAGADEPAGAVKEGKRREEFIAAFNRGDAKALTALWTEDGRYVDPNGVEVKGRVALEKMYEALFAEMKGAKLDIHVTSTKTLAPTVAIVEGTNELKPADGGPPSVLNFSAVFVHQDGNWLLDNLRESGVNPPSNAKHFADLEWLIGDWVGENQKGLSGTDSVVWAENRNFLVSSFASTLNGVPVSSGTRWVAWDAAAKQVRSWSFYSGGGFSEGVWTKNGNSWTIQTTGTTPEGKKATATSILTKVDDDHATWQSTRITVGDQTLPDVAPLKFKRVKEDEEPAR
jgi:uncharacterized protein (TIGR02246 family)